MTPKELQEEINEVIDGRRNGPIAKSWLVNEVSQRHADVQGADADLAIWCIRQVIDDEVRAWFRKERAKEEKSQMPLPGCRFLQERYLVPRNGDSTSVSIHELTRNEIWEKAQEYERFIVGTQKHRAELLEFGEKKFGSWADLESVAV